MTTPAAQRQQRRPTRRQSDLLAQLVAVMAAEGLTGYTLDEIAERLRCSKATLYAIAGSKQQLVVEVARQYFRDSALEVESRIADVTDPMERVVTYLRAVADRLAPLSRHFMTDLSNFTAANAVYQRNTAAAANRIRELIAEGIEAGVFRAVHAEFVGEMVAATMFGIQRGELFHRLELTDAQAYAELASLVMHALQPGP